MSKRTLTTLLTTLVLASVFLAACGAQAEATPTPAAAPAIAADVVSEGRLSPSASAYLFFGGRGTVTEILAEEGASVNQGDILATLDGVAQAQAAVAAAELELINAQQAYDALVRTAGLANAQALQAYLQAQETRANADRAWEALDQDAIDDRIDDAEAAVEDAKKALDDAQDEADKYKDLNPDNATRKAAEDDLEQAQEDYNEAVRDLESEQAARESVRAARDAAVAAEAEAKRAFENTLEGADKDKLALAEARLILAEAQLASATAALANFQITAPFDGTVADINVKVGEFVGPEKFAVAVADYDKWIVETTDLTELEVVNVREGQQVIVFADALPDVEMTGTVEFVSQAFRAQSGDILYTVTIAMDDVDPAARWGMTVEVNFLP